MATATEITRLGGRDARKAVRGINDLEELEELERNERKGPGRAIVLTAIEGRKSALSRKATPTAEEGQKVSAKKATPKKVKKVSAEKATPKKVKKVSAEKATPKKVKKVSAEKAPTKKAATKAKKAAPKKATAKRRQSKAEDGTWHKKCPSCDVEAKGDEEVDRVFGFRRMKSTLKDGKEVRYRVPQSYCRSCRGKKKDKVSTPKADAKSAEETKEA